MTIRRLPETLINRIAAGEVVERPAAAVKELVENAIDSGATRVDIELREGGVALIAVSDDGGGMSREDLVLAVERHATSKLPDDDLLHIATLGFRGEALPSIGAVARLTLTSRKAGSDSAWALSVEGGQRGDPIPAAHPPGTKVEVRDLFYATPARLKFLKSERTEAAAAIDAVERLALACPSIAFSLTIDGRLVLKLPAAGTGESARLERLVAIIGRDFIANALPLDAARDDVRLTGHAGLPTYHRATGRHQYLFVNGRPVRDKLLGGALRAAYQDLLARDRHPVAALFIDLPLGQVDVNVHPAKAEVRFRDGGSMRGLIIGALRHALAAAGHRAASTPGIAALAALRPADGAATGRLDFAPPRPSLPRGLAEAAFAYQAPTNEPNRDSQSAGHAAPSESTPTGFPLGMARAQLHDTYIVAQTGDGIVIVDQHAAHERLVFERLKAGQAGGVRRQPLLVPEVVELGEAASARIVASAAEFAGLGLVVEAFGPGAVVVRETPAPLGDIDVQGLLRDLADELAETGEALALKDRLNHLCATLACHGSVRAGRRLGPAEMDALLREMEATPHSGQCGHGRPTYVELKLADIERLFGRK